jgi:signal transduction histidine kinase
MDLAYAIGSAGWLMYLLSANLNTLFIDSPWMAVSTHVGYQIAMIGVSFFLLVSASVTSFRVHFVWMMQGVTGLALLLAWNVGESLETDLAYRLWVALNLVCASALSMYLGLNVYRKRTYRCWLVFSASLLGLGISYEGLLSASRLHLAPTLAQYFYAFFLLLIWLLITNRAGRPEPAAELGTGQTHSVWENITGFFPDTDFSAPAVTNERRRIAQDLHDGVGSQIVNILATLDPRSPEHKVVALALEQCLLDLKIMVDSIDSSEGSVIDALGRLRYRVQHALDKLGIRMIWSVDVDGALQDFSGDRAQQVLRITQECLSNVMRHSRASVVEVICRHEIESGLLLLEVRDNGCGIASQEAGRPSGKGLKGLQQRADKLSGQLQIATKVQGGTCIRLLAPLQHEPELAGALNLPLAVKQNLRLVPSPLI